MTIIATLVPGRKPPRQRVVQAMFAERTHARAHSQAEGRAAEVDWIILGEAAAPQGETARARSATANKKTAPSRGTAPFNV